MTTDFDLINRQKHSKPLLLVLLGPTGTGKTDISLRLAEHFNAPIISSDSRQLYKELKIGTAAPTAAELARVPHFFIGSHSIFDAYNAGQYEADVIQLLGELFEKHPVVMLVGGSMMYIDAVCHGLDDIPNVDTQTREYWQQVYTEKGLDYVCQLLLEKDPEHYAQVDLQNYKRVLHALEICSMTGKTYSQLRTGTTKQRNFNILKIGLNRPRAELYDRINQRVDVMMQEGLLEEATLFFQHRHLNTLNTVGYKELYAYMEGAYPLDFAVDLIKQDSRRYAKRQMTWFNRDKSIHWFHPDDEQKIIPFVEDSLCHPDSSY